MKFGRPFMNSETKNSYFLWWLGWFIFVLLVQSTSFFSSVYFFAESLEGEPRWLAMGILFGVSLLALIYVNHLNTRLSLGDLGSAMQPFRTSRFTAAFLTVAVSCLLAGLIAYLFDQVMLPLTWTPSGALGALLLSLSGVVEFVLVYFLFQGRGITRL